MPSSRPFSRHRNKIEVKLYNYTFKTLNPMKVIPYKIIFT